MKTSVKGLLAMRKPMVRSPDLSRLARIRSGCHICLYKAMGKL